MKIGRNDPCLCGSGKKFKKCCLRVSEAATPLPGLPPYITCNECGGKAPKETFEILDTEGLDGIEVALTGICQDCDAPTIAVSGDPVKVEELLQMMNENYGGGGEMGCDLFRNVELEKLEN